MKTSSSILFWAVTLTLALGSVVPTAQTCSRYICTTTALTGSQCSKADSASSPSTYYLKPCANETEVCTVRFESAPDSCAPTRSNPIRYPGEECNSTKDCYRGTCDATAKICMAANATQSCEDSVDCNPGLYCEAKVCVATKNEGADCSSKQCNVNAVCSQGKCVRIGSLPIGASSSAAAACSTFYVRDGLCAEGLTLVRSDSETGPIVCPGVCQYKNKKGEIMEEKACICGMTESNESLCNPGVGDVDPKNYIDYVSDYNRTKMCHVSRGPLCVYKRAVDMDADYYQAVITYAHLTNWANYYNNSECVKAMINGDYWMAFQRSEDEQENFGAYLFLWVSIASAILAATALILLLKCKSSDEENKGSLVADSEGK